MASRGHKPPGGRGDRSAPRRSRTSGARGSGAPRSDAKSRGARADFRDRREPGDGRAPRGRFARDERPIHADPSSDRSRPGRSDRPFRAKGSGAARRSSRPAVRGRAGQPEPERLQKVLARMGVASRREAEDWIRAGRITVNGRPAVLGMRVGRSDHIRLDGRLVHRHEVAAGQVYLCHRSPGENLRTPDEPSEHQALLDRLPRRAGNRFIPISPMPRIDGGLEIVTSDGEIAAQLQRTVHSLESEFSVRVRGELEEHTLSAILEGELDRGERLQVASCEPAGGEGVNRWYTLIAKGGSGKDVRQLFERHGALVSRVLRTRLGALELDRRLSRGQFRPLTREEIDALLAPPDTADDEEEISAAPVRRNADR